MRERNRLTMSLYVGTNYHPHDWSEERWKTDIALMQAAGFTMVRLGHLCWDSYEPDDGNYTFEWFDEVMDAFSKAGIAVFLDISMRPAPVWVHRLCPGCDIWSRGGVRQAPLRRYMEDVADPEYQYFALRFARVLVKRYAGHPALAGFGLCNELGDGPISYSEAAQDRFRIWLREKYTTIENLNQKWNTRRWSRRLQSFEDVYLQENEISKGSPEARLDMRRFFGDGVLDFITKLKEVVEQEAPGKMHSSNHVAEADVLGFDYLKGCGKFVDYPGFGFYPNLDAADKNTIMYVLMYLQHRLAELDKPMWCLEFQTGNFGCCAGAPGLLRMYALICLAYRTQTVLAWTWRSMLGGEEQFYFGLLDHDGTCSRKYDEFAQIAKDFKKLEFFGFPYLPEPEAAIAYHFDNLQIYENAPHYFRKPYKQQVADVVRMFYDRNQDCNIVNLEDIRKNYKILIIPGHAMMTRQMADNIRKFVQTGGIAVMTAYCAKVDGNNTVFDTPWPGLVSDVFGIRIGEFEHTRWTPAPTWEQTPKRRFGITGNSGSSVCFQAAYHECLFFQGACSYAVYTEGAEGCAVSVNRYGKGKAYYVSAEADTDMLGWLYDEICMEEGLDRGLCLGEGIVARKIRDREYLVINTTQEPVLIKLSGAAHCVLQERDIADKLLLKPFDGDLLIGDFMMV